MLRQRVITAVLLLAVLLPAMISRSAWWWGVVSLVLLSLAAWEWGRLLRLAKQPDLPQGRAVHPSDIFLALLVAVLALVYLAIRPTDEPVQALLLVTAVAGLFWLAWAPFSLARLNSTSGGRLLAVVALLLCWISLLELHQFGLLWMLSALAVVWVADIGAYFVGRQFGRHKLAPKVSPGKSWEGAIGGAFFVVFAGLLLAAAPTLADTLNAQAVAKLSVLGAILLLLVLVTLSVLGDLFESMLKRQAKLKDSSRLLPGHGGVLDRIDALIPTMPLAYAASVWLRSLP
jgi:phosphatidate cytidylyltransferase